MNENSKCALNYQELQAYLPHRPPFLLVERVLSVENGKDIHATKAVSALEPFFPGHFPDGAVYPGVLILEGLAQAGCILAFKTFAEERVGLAQKCRFTSIDKAKFRRPVYPGDVIHYHVQYVKKRGNFVWLTGIAKVDSEIVAEMNFSAAFYDEGSK